MKSLRHRDVGIRTMENVWLYSMWYICTVKEADRKLIKCVNSCYMQLYRWNWTDCVRRAERKKKLSHISEIIHNVMEVLRCFTFALILVLCLLGDIVFCYYVWYDHSLSNYFELCSGKYQRLGRSYESMLNTLHWVGSSWEFSWTCIKIYIKSAELKISCEQIFSFFLL